MRKMVSVAMKCASCGTIYPIPIWRKKNMLKKKGHKKKLHCLKCGTETLHKEFRGKT